MNTRPSTIRDLWLLTAIIGLLAIPGAGAHAGRGGHSGGGGGMRAPHVSGGARSFKAPRMSHSPTPARVNVGRANSRGNNSQGYTNTHAMTNASQTRTGSQGYTHNAHATTSTTQSLGSRGQLAAGTNVSHTGLAGAPITGTLNIGTTRGLTATGGLSSGTSPSTYTYGTGGGSRSYRAYGYGNGYRNHRYGGGYGYGRSQGNNRAVVARLRAVEASLAHIKHDYQGHRVRAMHAVAMAIRQLSHRSMVYNGVGFSSGMNNGRAMGMRQAGGGVGARGNQNMTQAQSDSRMSQALRTLQGINMQLGSQGSTSGHARASGHIQRAMHELNVALSIR